VAAAAEWPGIRPVEGISPTPVLRPDGSIHQSAGYDPKTGVLYEPLAEFPAIPETLTRADVAAAVAALVEVVCDFPFERPEHQAAWVAGVLTPFARSAYRGPSPLFLVDANVRAAGKSLLADAAGTTAVGSDLARRSYPAGSDRAEEMRKVITALAVAGERLVLLDNLDGVIGDSSLDAALTATEWTDRLLGYTQIVKAPLLMTWWATGNNIMTAADTSRRVLPIRLQSAEEHPEKREGFRNPDLLAWVRRERGRLVAAALTVLAGYIRAGRPNLGLKPWGSFEGWSGLVRSAVVWAGLPDPRAACEEFADRADTDAAALGALLAAWSEVDPGNCGLTVGGLLHMLKAEPIRFPRFREALFEFCPSRGAELPDGRQLGYRFRRYARRNVGGRMLENRPGRAKIAVWFVTSAARTDEHGDAWEGDP
jgi:hypothetical protein